MTIPARFKTTLIALLLLHVLALHCSIAGMEIFAWATFVTVVGFKLVKRDRFHFPLAISALGLVLTVLISLLINTTLRPFWFQFGFMRWIFLMWSFYWAFELVWDDRFERKLTSFWVICFLITAAYGTFQFLTGIDLVRPSAHVVYAQGGGVYKATGFFSFSLTYAYLIGASFFGVLIPAFRSASIGKKTALLAAGALGVISSMSKGAWISAIAAGLFYLGNVRRRLVPAFVAVVVAVGVGLAVFSEPFRAKLGAIVELRPDHSASMRLDIWRGYLAMFKEHPWFGIGLFQGDKLLPEYYQRLGITQEFVSHAHNVPLQWAAGCGIFALLFYIWISATFLLWSWRLRDRTPWGWSLLLAQIYLHLGGLTEANFFDGEVNHLTVFIWALVLFLYARAESQTSSQVMKSEA